MIKNIVFIFLCLGIGAQTPQAPSPPVWLTQRDANDRFINEGRSPHAGASEERRKKPMNNIEVMVNLMFKKNKNIPVLLPLSKPSFDQNKYAYTATWIGHATVLLQLGNIFVLTDPIFSQRASPVSWAGPQRMIPPAVALDKLPHISYILISHSHYDHLDLPSLLALEKQVGGPPQVLAPLGLAAWLKKEGLSKVEEYAWGTAHAHDSVRFIFTPAHHWSQRSLLDRNKTLWGGWIITTANKKIFFAGDTGASTIFDSIGHYGPFDLALLPIGAYEPQWFMQQFHINPEEAFQIHKLIKSRLSIGIHWGTFRLSEEPYSAPQESLNQLMRKYPLASPFKTPLPGTTVQF